MGNVAKYQHGWNMTFTVVELLMIIPKSTYLSISLPYFSIYHFFSLTLLPDNQADYYSLLTSTGGVLPLGNIKDNPIPLTSLEIAGVDNLQIQGGIRERYINLFEELGRNVH